MKISHLEWNIQLANDPISKMGKRLYWPNPLMKNEVWDTVFVLWLEIIHRQLRRNSSVFLEFLVSSMLFFKEGPIYLHVPCTDMAPWTFRQSLLYLQTALQVWCSCVTYMLHWDFWRALPCLFLTVGMCLNCGIFQEAECMTQPKPCMFTVSRISQASRGITSPYPVRPLPLH